MKTHTGGAAVVVGGLIFAAATWAPAVLADQSTQPVQPQQPLRMQDTVTVLKPVTVQGDRGAATGRTSGTTVRMDRSKLVRFAPATVSDAVVAIPGVDMSKTGPWASRVSMRGLSGERVLVLVDGVRLQTGRGHGAQTSLVSMDRIETVEATPGAGGAQNGSDALAGTLEMSTHRSLFADRTRATLTLNARGSDAGGEHSEFGRFRWMARNCGIEVSGGTAGLSELVTPDSTYANSGYREQDVAVRGAYKRGAAHFDYEHSMHASYDVGLPAFQSTLGSDASFPLVGRDADRFELNIRREDPRALSGKLLAVQQHFRTYYDETVINERYVRGRLVSTAQSDARSRIATWSKSVQPSVTWRDFRAFGEWRRESTFGPNYGDSTVRNTAGEVTYQGSRITEDVPPAYRDVYGAGFSGAIHPAFGVRIDGGARWDHMHSVTHPAPEGDYEPSDVVDRKVSGELGVSRAFGELTPYAHFASNFRAPNLEERYANMLVHGSLFVFGNPDLRPEQSLSTEVGVRTGELLGGHVTSARLSAYRSDVEDLISIQYVTLVFGVARFQNQNVNRARLEGLEAQADMRFGRVQPSLALAFPRGENRDTGEPIANLGASRATLDVRLPAPRFMPLGTFAFRVRWTDAARTSQGEEVLSRPAFWTASAEAGFTALATRFTLAVRNLTNTRYQEPLSFIPEPGRSFTLSVRRDLTLPWFHGNTER